MRIGTWNLAGRWTADHERFLVAADCDVWLLTEVADRVELPGFHRHVSAGLMAAGRRWAGVYSRPALVPLPDPHVASAAARIAEVTFCSSVLPWRSCGGEPTWPGADHAERTAIAVQQLVRSFDGRLVWGGDWNSALDGPEYAGSRGGRLAVLDAVEKLGLKVPTTWLPHRLPVQLSIDHVAVGHDRGVVGATRLDADGLSDHDGYVVELAEDGPGREP